MNDLRFALRQLFRSPGFTLVAIVTLALGIGANTAIFGLVNAVLLRPLPYAEPERLVTICESNLRQGWDQYVTSLGAFHDWRRQSTAFADMGIIALSGGLLKIGENIEHIERGWASASYFSTLGIKPLLGRTFLPEEDKRENAEVVILSEGLWRRRFGSDRDIIGKAVQLGDRTCTVVGVMPASFKSFNAPLVNGWESGKAVDLWWPPHTWPEKFKWRAMREYLTVGRLKPGITPAQAQQEMSAIAARMARDFPASNQGWGVTVKPLHEQITGSARLALLVLLGAAGLVLLVACANVANLQLARAAGRRKEFAVRAALGAGRARVARQLLAESLFLALPGAAAGLLLAWWGVRALVLINPANLPRLDEVNLDARVLGFTLIVTLLTALLFGLFPALHGGRLDLNTALRASERGSSDGPGGNRLRGALVIAEVAFALALLAGTGLLGRSFLQLLRVNPGFDPLRVFVADVSLYGRNYTNGAAMIDAVTRLANQLNSLPGVESAATINGVPFGNQAGLDIAVDIQDTPVANAADKRVAGLRQASPRYFETMRAPLLRGRAFTAQDNASAQPVAIINETFARRYFPKTDPLGQRLLSPDFGNDACEIVGVTRDLKQTGLDTPPAPEVYRPHFQSAFSEL
ncbi:MAG TPA: ABC transporter permease, partial [Verrucomicrobiae bacterium]|nr:ABC transporter permease [Verrucomicrobiae bacterium]